MQRLQKPLQTPACAGKQHPGGGGTNPQPLPNFFRGHLLEAAQAEDLSLPPGQLAHGQTQTVGKFNGLGLTGRTGFPANRVHHVGVGSALATLPAASPQQIQRSGGGQVPKQRRPITNGLAPLDPDRLQKRFLDAVPCVGMIADEPIDRAPHDFHVLAYDRFPIRHSWVPVKNRGSRG